MDRRNSRSLRSGRDDKFVRMPEYIWIEFQSVTSFGLRGVGRYKDAPSEKSGVDRVSSRAQESVGQGSQHDDAQLHATVRLEMRPIEQHGYSRHSTDDGSQQAEAKHTEQA